MRQFTRLSFLYLRGSFMQRQMVAALVWTGLLAALLGIHTASAGEGIKELLLSVPVYHEITTHVHYPADLKSGERFPALLLVPFQEGCQRAKEMVDDQRIVCIHFSPREDLPAQHAAWEESLGYAGQDAIAKLLEYLQELPEVDKDNVGVATISFGVVGATGALARHPDLRIKYLIDWEGPSGPQNIKWARRIIRRSSSTRLQRHAILE